MPNYVLNKLKFSGSVKNIKSLRESITSTNEKGEINHIDFKKIIPMPESLDVESGTATDYGIAVIKFLEEGDDSLLRPILNYTWAKAEGIVTSESMAKHLVDKKMANIESGKLALENLKTYGHKDWFDWCCANWGTKWNSCYSKLINDNEIIFDTAWAAPILIVTELSIKNPNVKIELRFADEDFGYGCGIITFKNGKIIRRNIPVGGTVEAYLISCKIRDVEIVELIERFCEPNDDEQSELYLAVLTSKFKLKEVVNEFVNYKHTSEIMLSSLKDLTIALEEYELIDKIDCALENK